MIYNWLANQHCVFPLFVTFFMSLSLSFYPSLSCFLCPPSSLFSMSILISFNIVYSLCLWPFLCLSVYLSIHLCLVSFAHHLFLCLSFYISTLCIPFVCDLFYVSQSIFLSIFVLFPLPTIFFYVYPYISQHCVFPLFVTFFMSLSLSFYPSLSCFLCPPSFSMSILISLNIVYSICLWPFLCLSVYLSIHLCLVSFAHHLFLCLSLYLSTLCIPFVCDLFYVSQSIFLSIFVLFPLPTIFFYVYPYISQHCVFPLFVTFFMSLSLSFYPSLSCFLCPPSFSMSILISLNIVYSLCLWPFLCLSVYLSIHLCLVSFAHHLFLCLSLYLSTLCIPFVCDLFYVSQSIFLSIFVLFPLPTIFFYVYPYISQHCVFRLFVTFFMSLCLSFYPSLSCFLGESSLKVNVFRVRWKKSVSLLRGSQLRLPDTGTGETQHSCLMVDTSILEPQGAIPTTSNPQWSTWIYCLVPEMTLFRKMLMRL